MFVLNQWVGVGGGSSSRKSSSKTVSSAQETERSRLRLQDRELQEISDGGWCLSMHQPWASLLVKGIKRYRLVKHTQMNVYEHMNMNIYIYIHTHGPVSVAGVLKRTLFV